MARRVKISLLGVSEPMLKKGREPIAAMIAFWAEKVKCVLPDRPDLLLLPEVSDWFCNFTTTGRKEFDRRKGNRIRDFWSETARKNRCYVAYSAYRYDKKGVLYNSIQMIDRQGEIAGVYNKNHLFIGENTDRGVSYEEGTPLISCDFGTVGCAICYDLNFDELRAAYAKQKPDLILFSSMYHGGFMQNVWAYSCRAHFASAIAGTFPSQIITPQGTVIAQTTNYVDFVTATVNLDCRIAHLDFHGGKLSALKKKYGDRVIIYDPGRLGSVLITSEDDGVTVTDMMEEFGIEFLDDYFNRTRAHRLKNLPGRKRKTVEG